MAGHLARATRADLLVAAGCAVLSLGLLLLVPLLGQADPAAVEGAPDPAGRVWWASLGLLLAQSAALVWRRPHPEVVAGLSAVAVPIGAAVGMGPALGLTSVALLVAVYTLATLRAPTRSRPLLTLIGVLIAGGHLVAGLRADLSVGQAVGTALLQVVSLIGAPLLVAALVVARREARTAGADRLSALAREQEALIQAAVARERTAMARELHDIAAHHLTGIAVMSAAIAGQIDTDPAAAKASVGEVRRQSTAVLRDLRSLVGLLRDQDETAGATAGVRVETLAGLPDLVGGVTSSGQDVGLTVLRPADGRSPDAGIGPLAQLAAYRMVQEALANAARHAPGARCEVEVDDRDPAALVVTVRNGPAPHPPDPGARGGLGLVGMRERAELTGSRLEAGVTPDGGWLVRLSIPRAEPVGTP